MKRTIGIATLICALAFVLPGCKRTENEEPAKQDGGAASKPEHVRDDGSTHADHGDGSSQAGDAHAGGGGHAHDEVPLGTATIGDMKVELAQGHGKVEAGKEGHLVVKLPHNDKGATIVRAWIGTADRFSSLVGKGTYAPSHDDYDIHAVAPSPLPENTMWWIEIETPDGKTSVGSAKALME